MYCSVLIPVYNSENFLRKTIRTVIDSFSDREWDYELILINDGSGDGSWDVLSSEAERNSRILAIDLAENYGQHTALFCGLNESSGKYVLTMDDDLQNPPDEIFKLLESAQDGHDLVFGRFRAKKHAWYRRFGGRLVHALIRMLYHAPQGLAITNFRLMERTLVNRICSLTIHDPYITGLAILNSRSPADVLVEHHEHPPHGARYGLLRLLGLIGLILKNAPHPMFRSISTWGLALALAISITGIWLTVNATRTGGIPILSIIILIIGAMAVATLLPGRLRDHQRLRSQGNEGSSAPYRIRRIVGRP